MRECARVHRFIEPCPKDLVLPSLPDYNNKLYLHDCKFVIGGGEGEGGGRTPSRVPFPENVIFHVLVLFHCGNFSLKLIRCTVVF